MDDLATGPVPDDALPPVVSAQEWERAYAELLVEEKALTRARDALAAKRRRMPMTAVTKDYRFVGPDGEVGLAEMFAGRAQLILYRFFFDDDVDGWPDKGCGGCSFLASHVADLRHINARDTTFAMTSPASPGADHPARRADGLVAHPLVHDARQGHRRRLRRRPRRRSVVRVQRVPARWRPGVPHVLRQRPGRRGVHPHVGDARPHAVRPAGELGRHPAGSTAIAALRLVGSPRRVRTSTSSALVSATSSPGVSAAALDAAAVRSERRRRRGLSAGAVRRSPTGCSATPQSRSTL